MKRPRPQFQIGDYVEVAAVTDMVYDDANNRGTCTRGLEKPICGWICGAVRRQTGTYESGGRRAGLHFDDVEAPALHHDGTVLLWQVKTSLLGKPIEALAEHITRVSRTLEPRAGWQKGEPYSLEAREEMRQYFAHDPMPRGPGGRFLKRSA